MQRGLLNQKNNNDKRNLFILLLLALSIRIILYPHLHLIAKDGAFQYIPVAKLYACGEFKEALSQMQTPLYPFLIALVSKSGLDMESAGRLISLIFNTLTIIPLYFLGKKLFKSSNISFLAGFLLAIHPYFVRFSVDVLKEAPYIFFFVTALWLSYEALSSEKLWLYLLAGITIGFSCLIRADGIEILIIVSLWILFQKISEFRKTYKRRIGAFFLLSAFSFVLVAPYLWHIRQTTGEWNLSKKIKLEVLIGPKSFVKEDNIRDVSVIRKHTQGFLLFTSKSVNSFHPLLLIFLLFGLVKRKTIPYQKREEFFLASFFGIHLFVLYFMAANYSIFREGHIIASAFSGRHVLPLVVISFFWMGMGIGEVRERIYGWIVSKRDGVFSSNLSRRVLVVILAVIALSILPKTLKPQGVDKLGGKIAGIWIKENSGKKAPIIMTNMPQVAYYAMGNPIRLPKTSYKKIISSAKIKVDYLVINCRDIEKWSPNLLKLCGKNDSLKMVFEYQEKRQDRVIVYRIID